MERGQIKTLIELATDFEGADKIISKYTEFSSDAEKVAYLQGMFDCKIIGRNNSDVHTDYVALLTAIVNSKWRG